MRDERHRFSETSTNETLLDLGSGKIYTQLYSQVCICVTRRLSDPLNNLSFNIVIAIFNNSSFRIPLCLPLLLTFLEIDQMHELEA